MPKKKKAKKTKKLIKTKLLKKEKISKLKNRTKTDIKITEKKSTTVGADEKLEIKKLKNNLLKNVYII